MGSLASRSSGSSSVDYEGGRHSVSTLGTWRGITREVFGRADGNRGRKGKGKGKGKEAQRQPPLQPALALALAHAPHAHAPHVNVFSGEPLIVSPLSLRLSLPLHAVLTPASTLNTFHYLYNRMKMGIFVQISNGELKIFSPFVNRGYRNEWKEVKEREEKRTDDNNKKNKKKKTANANANAKSGSGSDSGSGSGSGSDSGSWASFCLQETQAKFSHTVETRDVDQSTYYKSKGEFFVGLAFCVFIEVRGQLSVFSSCWGLFAPLRMVGCKGGQERGGKQGGTAVEASSHTAAQRSAAQRNAAQRNTTQLAQHNN